MTVGVSVEPIRLDHDEIHVWTAALDDGSRHAAAFSRLLASDELARAARFRFAADRERYVAGRAWLRIILAAYLAADPAAPRFATAQHGKPYLTGSPDHADVRFNLSHSRDVCLYAFALEREVGIDVEHIRPGVDADGIASYAFSNAECLLLENHPHAARHEPFFRGWTRKEAYVKARGLGLSYQTRTFTVSLDTASDDALLEDERDPGARYAWRIIDLATVTGYRAALAAAGRSWSVQRYHVRRLNVP